MERSITIKYEVPKFRKTICGEMFNSHNYTSKDNIQTSNKYITINEPSENFDPMRNNDNTQMSLSQSGMVNINHLIKSSQSPTNQTNLKSNMGQRDIQTSPSYQVGTPFKGDINLNMGIHSLRKNTSQEKSPKKNHYLINQDSSI